MHTSPPDIKQCIQLMTEYEMWENIRRHCFMVARVADTIHSALRTVPGVTIPSRELILAGSLLHDIAKSKCLEEGCRHAEVGASICDEIGFPEVAEAVANHVIIHHFHRDRYARGEFGAVEFVFYADKRVRHDEVVSLDERLTYILEKYARSNPEYEETILENFRMCEELEKYFFQHLDITPDLMAELVRESADDLSHYPPE